MALKPQKQKQLLDNLIKSHVFIPDTIFTINGKSTRVKIDKSTSEYWVSHGLPGHQNHHGFHNDMRKEVLKKMGMGSKDVKVDDPQLDIKLLTKPMAIEKLPGETETNIPVA